jgi:hypothetical protein
VRGRLDTWSSTELVEAAASHRGARVGWHCRFGGLKLDEFYVTGIGRVHCPTTGLHASELADSIFVLTTLNKDTATNS